MSVPRTLLVTERVVAPERRARFVESLAERRDVCRAVGAQFWVFEHETESGRYLEFVEARDRAVLDTLSFDESGSMRWRSVELG